MRVVIMGTVFQEIFQPQVYESSFPEPLVNLLETVSNLYAHFSKTSATQGAELV
jgi:hypothetical protein